MKKAGKKKSKFIDVYVTYKGIPDTIFDDAISRSARSCHGRCGGSGYLIPKNKRDIGFTFKEMEDVKVFKRYVLSLYKVEVEIAKP